MITADVAVVPAAGAEDAAPRARRLSAEAAALWQKFPPRAVAASWPATQAGRGTVVSEAMTCPYAAVENDQSRYSRRLGIIRMLDWLETQPGATWQDRWHAGCRSAAGQDWRDVAERWLKDTGRIAAGNRAVWQSLGGALGLLIGRDVIRPDLGWLLASATPAHLAADMSRVRDPAGFAALEEAAGPASVSVSSTRRAMLQVAVIMAVKGGMAGDVTVGDCLELLEARARAKGDSDNGGTYFYQLLHAAGFLPAGAPPRAGMLNPRVRGQLSAGQLIDRYDLACRPVRDLLVDYLNERRPGIDYVTMNGLAYQLGLLFWKDLETHHPGIGSLNLAPDVAVAWKQRMQSRTVQTTGPGGERTQSRVPRLSVVDHLTIVRSFYLDIAEWAAIDPSRWAQWAVPCPVRPGDLTHRQALRRRKSRTDQRTRERLPVLPRLIAAAERELAGAASRLAAAAAAAPGQELTAGGQTLVRAILKDPSPRIWAEDRGTGKRRNLTEEEEQAFWAWASIELLRHSGIRVEELAELSHHSLVRYQLPGAEPIPLLHIAPSKTDIERMLVISPELSEVLAVVIERVRGQGTGAVPLVTAYDPLERVWNPPSPLLLQRRAGTEDRPFSRHYIKRRIEDTAMAAGLTASTGAPLTFTPHDMRRIFTTEALQNGLPPHICQLILGHKNLSTTMGYNMVYLEKVITGHRAFLARRRQLRPAEEYRTPTEAEWEEFLGHFERRKVALGDCGRAYGTGCVHEMACERCSLLRIDPAQRPRLDPHPRQPGRTGHRSHGAGLARRARRPPGLPRDGHGETPVAGRADRPPARRDRPGHPGLHPQRPRLRRPAGQQRRSPVNGRPAPQHPLARSLRARARGIYPDEAAIELLIGHGTFLDRDDFTRHITTGEHSRPGGKAAHAAIDWTAAATALDAGTLPCSGGERRIFRLAASLAAGLPVNLRDALTGLDEHNLTLAISAFMHASGHRPPHLEP